jgi:hypothetical protein
MTRAPEMTRRPRKGQVWRDEETGWEVVIECRRTFNPMLPARPHSDMRWTKVAYVAADAGGSGGVMHESDFCRQFEFVRGRA